MSGPATLVTGGCGFIGRHLARTLWDRGHEVFVVDNLSTGHLDEADLWTVHVSDIRDHPSYPIPHLDYIYHLASPASPPKYQEDPISTLTTNVVGTLNMLALAARHEARFLLASTSEVYGEPSVNPQPETYRGNVNTLGVRACYDEGKRAAETLTADASRLGVDASIARIFNTYGPGMARDDGRVIPNFIRQAQSAEPITIEGDGEQTRSFCYVEDTVQGLILLAESDHFGPINIGNPEEVTVNHLANLIAPGHERVFLKEAKDAPTRRCPDVSQAKDLLGWTPAVHLTDGVARMVAAECGVELGVVRNGE